VRTDFPASQRLNKKNYAEHLESTPYSEWSGGHFRGHRKLLFSSSMRKNIPKKLIPGRENDKQLP
jgi:hypothetical protein